MSLAHSRQSCVDGVGVVERLQFAHHGFGAGVVLVRGLALLVGRLHTPQRRYNALQPVGSLLRTELFPRGMNRYNQNPYTL